ncbi:helix-turn-helix transcriptional regulator [Pseudomonas sp. ATCC PTA-122608]|uniref:helix-turn-helix transcriptional regulator n=1 Tax=Pseudomonas sp. ATCC PTA-122608 TaxID=1771311 RepID=UPI00096BBB81|nr:helix-turn-helix transcriptional regulator [Pseudomonas sp. ATCC PTA-122608]OLY73141.1 helix-turn-helix transcriptional regulator [Pseudomonas sp. ATCC PTA-122608]
MARVTDSIGQSGFAATLFEALGYLQPIQATTLYFYPRGGMPSALFELEGPWLPQGNVRQYLSGFYLLDPFYGACVEGVSSGCYDLADVAPDHFELSEYFQSFYRHSHLEDELNYILQSSNGSSLAVSLAFTQKLDAATTQQFKRIAPWVLAMLGKHFVGLDAHGARFENLLEQRIHSALNNFGSSILTERECRIAQLILRGHSTRSLAERLDVSEDTIKSHRKHIYTKLDIGAQSELFALFIDSLAEAQGVLSKDPLESYMSKHR